MSDVVYPDHRALGPVRNQWVDHHIGIVDLPFIFRDQPVLPHRFAVVNGLPQFLQLGFELRQHFSETATDGLCGRQASRLFGPLVPLGDIHFVIHPDQDRRHGVNNVLQIGAHALHLPRHALALRYIFKLGHEQQWLAAGVMDGPDMDTDVKDATVLADAALFDFLGGGLPFPYLSIQAEDHLPIVRVYKIGH